MEGNLTTLDKMKQQEWKCWMCEKDKTGMIELEMHDADRGGDRRQICLDCIKKMVKLTSQLAYFSLTGYLQHLEAIGE